MSVGKYQRVTRKKIVSLIATIMTNDEEFFLFMCLYKEVVSMHACVSVCSIQQIRFCDDSLHRNHTSIFAIISFVALYMSNVIHHAYSLNNITCFVLFCSSSQTKYRNRGILVDRILL